MYNRKVYPKRLAAEEQPEVCQGIILAGRAPVTAFPLDEWYSGHVWPPEWGTPRPVPLNIH